jgi:hypothetical protein
MLVRPPTVLIHRFDTATEEISPEADRARINAPALTVYAPGGGWWADEVVADGGVKRRMAATTTGLVWWRRRLIQESIGEVP